ncbi:MAG: FHA domain-containing protein [Planctomycetota bacterium]|nr:MAG: FHA domain-containing protein [Planctomycetota bacterium]
MAEAVISMKEFISHHRGLAEKDFLQKFPLPFLVVPGDKETVLPRKGGSSPKPIRAPLQTMKMSIEDLEETLPPSFRKVLLDKAMVFPLETRENAHKLKVGRAAESDLILEDPEVSLHHATIYWKETPPSVYYLKDHHSTNGTYYNGVAIPPEEEIELEDECTLEFGLNRLFIFYYPQTFYRCVNLS